MVSVGIKELTAKLSSYVRAARSGETVLVTDRGVVVAVLGSADDAGRPRDLSTILVRLAADLRLAAAAGVAPTLD